MRAAIYCRLSEEDRNKKLNEDSESIQNQKDMLTDYAKEKGWEIYDIYSDDDYTGSDRKRPEFNRLIRDAGKKKFDIVLCKNQSRFTREMEIVEKYIHGLFPLWGIRFVSVVDNADTEVTGNKKARQINGLINEWYLEDMSENIKSVLSAKRKRGYHIGSFALYGYKKDSENKGRIVIDEEAARIVRKVFSMFAEGTGKTAIARYLNERGIPNPTEYKKLKGLNYRQGKNCGIWTYSTISSMLKNEMYIGNMVQGKCGSASYKTKKNMRMPREQWYIVKNTHEPIIDRETWKFVQETLKKDVKPYKSGEIGIFAGKAYCMYCGKLMRSAKSHGKHYLKCSAKTVSPQCCKGGFISCDALESAVKSELKKLTDVSGLDEYIKNRGMKKYEERCDFYKKKLRTYENALKTLYIDRAEEKINEIDFEAVRKSILHEKVMAENELNSMCDVSIDKFDFSLNREIAGIFIERLEIGKKDETGYVPVKIYWNF